MNVRQMQDRVRTRVAAASTSTTAVSHNRRGTSCDTFASLPDCAPIPQQWCPTRTECSTTTLPMYPAAPVTKIFIDRSFASSNRILKCLKRLSDEFFNSSSKALPHFRESSDTAHSFADALIVTWSGTTRRRGSLAMPAPISSAGGHDTGPHRSCGSLRNGLHWKGALLRPQAAVYSSTIF